MLHLILPLLTLATTILPIHASPLQPTTHQRQQCQSTATNCPPGTILVSPTDPTANYTTIQSAISSLPDNNTTATILILPGTYHEQLNITRSAPITLLGSTSSPNDASRNEVVVTWAAANHDSTGASVDNVFSSVMVVAPTLDASLTGSGPTGYPVPEGTPFGNRDFRVYNVDFVNDWAEYSDGPAHAMSFSRGNGGFYFCGFYSYQDTVYIGKLANTYIYKSIIAGETDFLYGFGTAYLQSSSLLLRSCGGGITAWKGTNTTLPNKYGIYIVDSTVTAANASIAPQIKGSCALGRPWNELHRSIFARCYEDGSIVSSGYVDWVVDGVHRYEGGVTLMGEFRDFGPGWNVSGRVEGGVDSLLDWREYEGYSEPEKVFQDEDGGFGDVSWIDWGTVEQ